MTNYTILKEHESGLLEIVGKIDAHGHEQALRKSADALGDGYYGAVPTGNLKFGRRKTERVEKASLDMVEDGKGVRGLRDIGSIPEATEPVTLDGDTKAADAVEEKEPVAA